jgi:16S rRNA (cytosine1402-N4)-methyltransferase
MKFEHRSVLLDECIDNLCIKRDGIYVDGTLGGGGHSYEIAKRLGDSGRLIGIDQDGDAVKEASERLGEFKGRVTVVRDNYCNMPHILDGLGIEKVDGVLLDLGVSSYQLDEGERGFSYMKDAPLDMRMDRDRTRSAWDVINTCSREELTAIIRDYGEEPFAANIARHIVEYRKNRSIDTTFELAEVIRAAIPMRVQKTMGHPAKRTFQAVRIEVNGELDVLKDVLENIPARLNEGGRVCIITFHSLEDRIVKNAFKKWENPCTCPPSFPVCVCGKKSLGRAVYRKPLIPSDEEQEKNPRSRSAKLRVFEKGRTER